MKENTDDRWIEALETRGDGTGGPNPANPIIRTAWRTIRALEFAAAELSATEVEHALTRLARTGVVQSPARAGRTPSLQRAWSESLERILAILRPDLTGPMPSLRSSHAFEFQVFETENFAVSLAPESEGAQGSVLPRTSPSLPEDGILRHLDSADNLIEQQELEASGHFRFQEVSPGDRIEIQIGGEWIELPPFLDNS